MKENQNTEWKESWRDDYLRWVCGFANAEGGTLVIGRNDRGEAVGVANAARLLEEIPNKARDVLGIMVDVNLVVEDGKDLLEIRVEPYPSPISYKGEYHFRSGSTKQELKGAALSHFLLKKQGLHWDGVALPGLKVDDLHSGALALFRQQAVRSQRLPQETLQEPDTALLERLHLLGKHASAPFNPDVANAFFRGGQIESWGRGIERMVQACLDAGLQPPVLQLEDGGVWVTFAFAPAKALVRGEKWGEKWGVKATVTRLALMQAMRRNPQISTAALAVVVNMASTSGVEKHLTVLREAGCIRRVGPAKGGTWEVMENIL